jgi:hypothetical protein
MKWSTLIIPAKRKVVKTAITIPMLLMLLLNLAEPDLWHITLDEATSGNADEVPCHCNR